MRLLSKLSAKKASLFRVVISFGLAFSLLLINEQVGSLFGKHAPAAGSRAARSSYYSIDCANDHSHTLRTVTPLPNTRYIFSDQYGWFDKTHFDTGNPAQIIADVQTAVAADGGIISISQPIRDGITGYTGNYLVSGGIAPGEVMGVALGIYMDWSLRFEGWQARLPRSLVGPFTPYAIEDLPTQYLGFYKNATHMELAAIFACYLGQVEIADTPPHIWVSNKHDAFENEPNLPHFERLTNKTFYPLILTKDGWQHIAWPAPLRLYPIPSSGDTWVFDSEQTWYLNQTIP